MLYVNTKVRNQESISKKSQNVDLPSSAFCSSEWQMSFCKTVFLHCFVALRAKRIVFFFFMIILDWCWRKTLVLKALLQGHKSASNTRGSEDVMFQNQAALAATTVCQCEWDPNPFSVGMNTQSLTLTGIAFLILVVSLTSVTLPL